MKTYNQDLLAGGVWDENIPGEYMEILALSLSGPVDVVFFKNNQPITFAEAAQVGAGTYFRPRGGFDRWQIKSATAQNVKIALAYGDSGTRNFSGNVTIVGVPAVTLSGNNNVVQQYQGGAKNYAASYKSSVVLAANTPDAVFTPGSNVNGAIVWNLRHSSINGANTISYLAKSTTPSTFLDGDVIDSGFGNSGAVGGGMRMDTPVFIAAGKGFWSISGALETTSMRSVLYTLL